MRPPIGLRGDSDHGGDRGGGVQVVHHLQVECLVVQDLFTHSETRQTLSMPTDALR